jgi:hypothetical protein
MTEIKRKEELSAKCTLFLCVKLGGRGGYRKAKKGQNRGLGLVGAWWVLIVGARPRTHAKNEKMLLTIIYNSLIIKDVKERAQQCARGNENEKK